MTLSGAKSYLHEMPRPIAMTLQPKTPAGAGVFLSFTGPPEELLHVLETVNTRNPIQKRDR